MPDHNTNPALPAAVRRTLDAVRNRIRAYVWLEGTAILIAGLAILFWLGLAADWYFEPSPTTRRVGIIAAACVAALLGYRYLLRRLIVPISDTTAAVLLERAFPRLKEHVITAVDISSTPDRAATFHPGLVAQTNEAAESSIAGVNPAELFNPLPITVALAAAAVLAGSV